MSFLKKIMNAVVSNTAPYANKMDNVGDGELTARDSIRLEQVAKKLEC